MMVVISYPWSLRSARMEAAIGLERDLLEDCRVRLNGQMKAPDG